MTSKCIFVRTVEVRNMNKGLVDLLGLVEIGKSRAPTDEDG